jgi:NAD(P)H-flavin reductase
MLQVAEHILDNPADTTKVSLLFANVSEGDILLKVGACFLWGAKSVLTAATDLTWTD